MLDTLAPLNEITELTQFDTPSWVIVLAKFNVIFLGFISLAVICIGEINKKHILMAIPIALTGVFVVDPIGAMLSLSNPQQLVIYPLLIISLVLLVQTVIPRFRTLARVIMSVVTFAVLVGALLIHISAVNIKMDSQARMLAEYNYMIADITFTNNPRDEKRFIAMCKSRNTYCRTEHTELIPTFYTSMTKANLVDILGSANLTERLSSPDDNRYVLLTNFNDLFGSEFQVASFSARGIERTIIDFDNTNKIHNQSKNIVYIWMAVLTCFWVYGGMYLYFFHRNRLRRHKLNLK